MTYFLYLLLVLAALFFELTLVDLISIKGVKPDVTVIVIGCIGLRQGRRMATGYGFLAGVLWDLFSSGILGLHALAASVAAFFSNALPVLKNHHTVFVVIQIGLVDLIYNLIRYLISAGTIMHIDFYRLPASFIYTLFFTLVIALLLPSHYLKHYSLDKSYY